MTRQYKKQFHSSFMYPIYNKLVLNTIRSLLGFDKYFALWEGHS